MDLRPFYRILSYGYGTYKDELHYKMMEILEKEGYQRAVISPSGDNINQWVAIHSITFYWGIDVVFFFNDINLLYGVVQENCTNYSCPFMSAGVNFEYLWADKYKYRKPSRVPAKTYIDNLMNWIVKLLDDDRLFPPNKDSIFPKTYVDKVKNICKRYFRVYAHIFYSHLDVLVKKGVEKMFFDSLTYFLIFIDMYSLIPSTDLRPLYPLMRRLVPDLKITQLLCQSEEEELLIRQRTMNHSASEGVSSEMTASENETNRVNHDETSSSASFMSTSSPHNYAKVAASNQDTVVKSVSDSNHGKNGLSSVSHLVTENLSTMGIASMVQMQETNEKANWEEVMKEGGSTAARESYATNVEREENCECAAF